MLKDMDAKGSMRKISKLACSDDFERQWAKYSSEEQRAIVEAIEAKLDKLVAAPDALVGFHHEHVHRGLKGEPLHRN